MRTGAMCFETEMVSSLLVDAINNPSSALEELYESATPEPDFPAQVSTHFSKIFSTLDAFQQIPSLSVRNPPNVFKDKALVRFRGMVQDTPSSSEMYLSRFPGGKCGGWALSSDHQVDDVDYADLAECNAFWVVTVPGETEWRAHELDGEDAAIQNSPTAYKRSRDHKNPHSHLPGLGVNVKVYDKTISQSLKPTDVFTFVGIITSEAIVSDITDDANEVPTLHVLFSQPHTQPLFRYLQSASDGSVYDDLVDWIAEEGLAGDRDVAEWVLLACISRVQSRQPPLLPPTLAVTRFPPPKSTSITPALIHVLSELLPLASILPLSLDLLNEVKFAPESKDEDLHSGYLQVPSGSTILITESGMGEGILNERGITNLRVVQEVMTSQTLEYIFPFSRFSFNTEINFIVLSEGKKGAFFKTDFVTALSVTGSEQKKLYKTKEQIRMPDQDKLESFRELIGSAKAGAKIEVGENMSKHIEEEFVSERKNDSTITHNDLVTHLTLAKLLTVSLNNTELTVDIWEKAKTLDQKRKSRLI